MTTLGFSYLGTTAGGTTTSLDTILENDGGINPKASLTALGVTSTTTIPYTLQEKSIHDTYEKYNLVSSADAVMESLSDEQLAELLEKYNLLEKELSDTENTKCI